MSKAGRRGGMPFYGPAAPAGPGGDASPSIVPDTDGALAGSRPSHGPLSGGAYRGTADAAFAYNVLTPWHDRPRPALTV